MNTVKAKFHYASWFEAGSELFRSWSPTSFEPDSVMEFGFEPVCDQRRTSFEPASVMKFCFNFPFVSTQWVWLANVNSRSRSLYAIARPSVVCLSSVVCRLSSVCRLSYVTFVRPTQAVQIFGNISTALGTLAIH